MSAIGALSSTVRCQQSPGFLNCFGQFQRFGRLRKSGCPHHEAGCHGAGLIYSLRCVLEVVISISRCSGVRVEDVSCGVNLARHGDAGHAFRVNCVSCGRFLQSRTLTHATYSCALLLLETKSATITANRLAVPPSRPLLSKNCSCLSYLNRRRIHRAPVVADIPSRCAVGFNLSAAFDQFCFV